MNPVILNMGVVSDPLGITNSRKETCFMRRIRLVLGVLAVVVASFVAFSGPAMADDLDCSGARGDLIRCDGDLYSPYDDDDYSYYDNPFAYYNYNPFIYYVDEDFVDDYEDFYEDVYDEYEDWYDDYGYFYWGF